MRHWTRTDIIAAMAAMINIVFLIFTILLWNEAVNSSKSAKEAANAADSTAVQAKRANDIAKNSFDNGAKRDSETISLAQKTFEEDENRDKKNIELARKSLMETQKEFTTINQPVIIVDSIKKVNVTPNKQIIIDYYITNVGSTPGQVYGFINKMKIIPSAQNNTANERYEAGDSIGFVTWLASSGSKLYFTKSPFILTSNDYDKFHSGISVIWFYGEVFYINPIKKQKNISQFSFILYGDSSYVSTPYYNQLREVSK
jgi:hypothetical protein